VAAKSLSVGAILTLDRAMIRIQLLFVYIDDIWALENLASRATLCIEGAVYMYTVTELLFTHGAIGPTAC
jgi:hypothetical protein